MFSTSNEMPPMKPQPPKLPMSASNPNYFSPSIGLNQLGANQA